MQKYNLFSIYRLNLYLKYVLFDYFAFFLRFFLFTLIGVLLGNAML